MTAHPSAQARAVDAFVLGPAGEILIDEARLNRAVRNVKRRADDLDLSRDLRSRLTETLRQQSATSVNPIFLPLFYEDYDDQGGFAQQKLSSVFDYLPQNALFVLNDPLAMDQAAQNAAANIDKLLYKAKASGKFYLESAGVYLDEETLTRPSGQVPADSAFRPDAGRSKQQNPIGDACGAPGYRGGRTAGRRSEGRGAPAAHGG